MFILTDAEAIVIAYDKTNYFNEKEKGTVHIEGLDFSEKSCGTNAISLSMETNGQVELKKEGHFNEKFKQWSCYAFPLYIEKDIIGYLNIASIKTKLKCEFKIIFELVANQILNELKKENTKEKSLLTRTQIDIIKKVSEGYTEKRIAYELHLSQDTIKYHKRRIYNKLNVQSSSQAVMECCRLGILSK